MGDPGWIWKKPGDEQHLVLSVKHRLGKDPKEGSAYLQFLEGDFDYDFFILAHLRLALFP